MTTSAVGDGDGRGVPEDARAFYAAGQYAQAITVTRAALNVNPTDAECWNALGVFLRAAGKPDEALPCISRALALDPGNAGAWSNLGNVAKDLKRFETAIQCHRHALSLRPDMASLHYNLGIAYMGAGRHRDALAAYHRALLLKPGDPKMRWDRALANLFLGELTAAWGDYGARFETGDLPVRAAPGQGWIGQPYGGQSLLVLSEQGFGDSIWAARYFPKARQLGGRLIVEARAELIPLFTGLEVADAVVAKGAPLPATDWHCHQCSLPGLFIDTMADVSGRPYLSAPQDRLAKFTDAMALAGTRLKVGIVWSGSTTFKGNADRAIALPRLAAALSMPGVQLYSLQKGPPRDALKTLDRNALGPLAPPVIDLGPLLGDFADTAAAVSLLDLVVMTDSATAHLCGALGRPVWVLLGMASFWMWGAEGETTPWYDSVRLFRSPGWDDWHHALDRVTAALWDRLWTGSETPRR